MLRITRGGYNPYKRNELKSVPVPSNIGGSRWRPVPHYDLVAGILEALKNAFGFVPLPESETYAVSPDGAALIGGFSLGTPPSGRSKTIKPLYMTGIPQETTTAIGFQHSNDTRKALRVYAGGTVSLCTNGMVSASHVIRHKHTTGFSLDEWIVDGLRTVLERAKRAGEAMEGLYNTKVTAPMHDRMLLALAREKIIPWRLIGQIDEAWNTCVETNGEVVQWVQDDRQKGKWGFQGNAWDWYNAVTYVARLIIPAKQLVALERAFSIACDCLPKKLRPDFEALDPEDIIDGQVLDTDTDD